eukprot:TRINITY_DN3560_c0_g1_i2.p1 TRINITY_DN3560_c0_g1~~TRINITY_DN3560_c0_g1_i2.p1  ORF type:complete len:957 (-),score=222.17 TRINITY_DN3560_c0_g1_i2:112-2982(-)
MLAIFQSLVDAVLAAKLELLVFFLAVFIHFLLFSNRLPQKVAKSKKGVEAAVVEPKDTKSNSSRDLAGALLRELRPLVRSGAKGLEIENAIETVLATQKVSPAVAGPALASVLESFRSPEVELLAAVRKFLTPEPGFAKVAEQLLQGYMGLRLRDGFYMLLSELDASYQSSGERMPSGVAFLALQSALADKNFKIAMKRLTDVAPAWETQSQLKIRDQKIMQQLTSLAAEVSSVPALLETMQSCGLCKAPLVEPILLEAAQREDCKLIDEVERFAKDQNVPLSPASRCSILLGLLASGCSDEELLNCYESSLKDVDVLTIHTKAGRAVAEAALRLNRSDLLAKLLRDCEDARRVGLLKSFGKEGRLEEAKQLLEACPSKSTCLHNALLDATVGCGNSKVLETAILEAETAGVADVVTYNTVIKGHLQRGDVGSARRVFTAMRASGLKPSVVTFNELLDAANGACWAIIDEMKFCEIKPNKVTCSILLKYLKSSSSPKDVERTMGVLGETSDDMDEVLLSSVCEACIRTNRSDILAQQLRRQRGPKAVQVQGAHTFGSLIRGYGFISDLQGVWATWRGMRSRHILPTSITLGCMIEALVSNDDIEAAYELVQETAADERTQGLVNSVIYGSLLKGFCRQRRFERVWTIYEEMLAQKMQLSIVTYNSLIDACARSGEMHRVQPLLEDMTSHDLSPNVITYSTVIKGYCSANRLDEAFALLQDMKTDSQLSPDEVTYNTLLDGCARTGLYDRGMSVLKEMCAAGMPPSNFTLSVLIKLATRAKQPAKAFELFDSIRKEYGIHPNVHVYNNLIQAATWYTKGSAASGAGVNNLGRDLATAMQTVERMFAEKVRPDARTYMLLLKCCIAANQPEQALQLLRSASGICGSHPRLQDFASTAPLRGGPGALPQELLIEVLDFACSRGHSPAAAMLVQELSKLPGAKISNKLCQQYTAKAIQVK